MTETMQQTTTRRSTKGMKQPKRARSYRNQALGQPEVIKIVAAAARLGLSKEELCEMAGIHRPFLARCEHKWKTNPHFCPRASTLHQLQQTLKDLRVAKKAEEKPAQEELKLVALTQDDIAEIEIEELRQVKENAAKVEKWRKEHPIQELPPAPRPIAAQVIRELIDNKLNTMTFLELALTLAHVMGEKK